MTDENKQVVRRGFEEGFNAGDLAVFDALTDVDYIDYEAMDQSRRPMALLCSTNSTLPLAGAPVSGAP
jgi:hypothetical protein